MKAHCLIRREVCRYVESRGRITFAAWFDKYLETTPKRASTAARDRSVGNRWLLPHLGALPIASITPAHVRRMVDAIAAERTPSTVRTTYAVLRAAMNAAVDADLLARSPCRGIKLSAERRHEPRFLSLQELELLAEQMPVEYRPMIYVAGVLGLRFSRWQDFGFDPSISCAAP